MCFRRFFYFGKNSRQREIRIEHIHLNYIEHEERRRAYSPPPVSLMHLLFCEAAEEERDHLTARAVHVRGEQTVARAGGNAVCCRPSDCIGVPRTCVHVTESACTCGAAANHAEEERCHLGAGTFRVGREQAVTHTVGDAHRHRPCDRLGVVGACADIAELRTAGNRRAAGHTPEERHHLTARAGGVRCEAAAANAVRDALFDRPRDCVGVVRLARNIGEGDGGCRLFFVLLLFVPMV